MDASDALQQAIETANFIRAQRHVDEQQWRRTNDQDAPFDPTLYHGTAGIIIFFLELAKATGDPSYLHDAIDAGEALRDRMHTKQWASVAFATGWAGYAFAFEVLWKETNDNSFRLIAIECIDRLMTQSQPIGAGIGWIEPMPFSDITGFTGDREVFDLSVGAAGAALYLLRAHTSGLHPNAKEWAIAIGERLLEVGEHTSDGTRWALMSDMPFPFTAPNFAHGGAGVGYFFAQLYDLTNDQRHLQAALGAGRYVMSRASAVDPIDTGNENNRPAVLVCHTEELKPPMFYLGECHGPTGTWRLLMSLARITGDASWISHADSLRNGIAAIGAPKNRSAGWWQNHGQCCGDAGLGDSALAMWSATNNDSYLRLAIDCAEVISTAATVEFANETMQRSWAQCEHRARPKFIQQQTGYMQGAAGIGSFLLHLAEAQSSEKSIKSSVRIWFPDEPM
jgi:lantibiotic modifying enzyme